MRHAVRQPQSAPAIHAKLRQNAVVTFVVFMVQGAARQKARAMVITKPDCIRMKPSGNAKPCRLLFVIAMRQLLDCKTTMTETIIATLSSLPKGYYLTAFCDSCRACKRLDTAKLCKTLGGEFLIKDVAEKLRCRSCGAKRGSINLTASNTGPHLLIGQKLLKSESAQPAQDGDHDKDQSYPGNETQSETAPHC